MTQLVKDLRTEARYAPNERLRTLLAEAADKLTPATHTKDRDYYRALSTDELLTEAKEAVPTHVDWHELATVLAERLKDAEWEVKEARYARGEY